MSYAKHPEPCKANLNYLVSKEHPKSLPHHQSIFEKLNASMVRKSALKTYGSHVPGLDANEWRRLRTSFKSSSTDLCKKIAKLEIRIAKSDLTFLLPYNSCRLIALDKWPGVRPIGFGEVLRRIIGRTIVKCNKIDLKRLGGDQHLYMGQKGGNEHAIYSLRAAFKNTDSKVILLIDAKNAFNNLNRDLTLQHPISVCG